MTDTNILTFFFLNLIKQIRLLAVLNKNVNKKEYLYYNISFYGVSHEDLSIAMSPEVTKVIKFC